MGIEVDIAETGNEACQKAATSAAERRPYDLIFMDMEMPEIDGYQATRRLRNLAWQGPVIAVTAHTGPGDCQRCLEVGCDDYLAKPLSVESLSVQLSRYLDRESHSTVSCPQRNETALPDPLLEPEVPQENPSDRQREASLLFLDGVWRHVEQIQAALRHLDRNGLMHETHRLAGSAGLFGFAEISNVARIVEGLLRQGADFARVSQPSERLIRLCREVLDRTQP
jgi:CheY-like chemotaxis protein